ncbi:hypothetical protein K7432_010491 [Basidiobolus ranarum]|uniref:Cyclin N-terminal domain-containing protein n=1 Tax=Basidiobolus ranarum TaxID=34480 RepID=A0ABR2VVI6_9FUNG
MTCVAPTPDTWMPLSDSFIGFTSRSVDSTLSCPTSPADATQSLPPLHKFIQQTTHGAKISAEILVASLIYIERFKKALPSGALGEYGTSHRIFLAGILIASKFLDDKPLTTAKLIQVIGTRWSSKEINRMERAFLDFLKFQLWVDSEEILEYISHHGIELNMEI